MARSRLRNCRSTAGAGGAQGAVASAAIEKPHRSGWTPLLECEFDLAYTPLMERPVGAGRAVWCQLDLEDHAGVDPAAGRLARQLVAWAVRGSGK